MTDSTTTPATPAATAGPDATSGAETNSQTNGHADADPGIGDAGKRALSELRRELKQVAAERDALAKAKKAAEDAERTELEKATSALAEATTELEGLRRESRARAAATAAGIPTHWHRLQGANDEELAADAKALAEELNQTAQPAAERLGAGARSTPATGPGAFSTVIRQQARRR